MSSPSPMQRIHLRFTSFGRLVRQLSGRVSPAGAVLPMTRALEIGSPVLLDLRVVAEPVIQARGRLVSEIVAGPLAKSWVFAIDAIDPASRATLDALIRCRRRSGEPALEPAADSAIGAEGPISEIATSEIDDLLRHLQGETPTT